jgi:hypothetical protein
MEEKGLSTPIEQGFIDAQASAEASSQHRDRLDIADPVHAFKIPALTGFRENR